MKPVFSMLIAASFALFSPQQAEACRGAKQWSQQDIAFADAIFEGRLTDVKLIADEKNDDRPSFFEFAFDVQDVVRGVLDQDKIVVGWIPGGHRNKWELNVQDLNKSIGEITRVAISTPQLASLFCEHDEDRSRPVCDYTVAFLEPAFKENIPFVLSNGYICSRSYLFPVQKYEDMRNYEKNYKAYEDAREIARKEARSSREGREVYRDFHEQRYQEMVPQGPLMWKIDSGDSRSSAVRLARNYKIFFTPALRGNAELQEAVVDLGVALARLDRREWRRLRFDGDKIALARFREDLKEEVLRLLGYMEKDPNYRNRLLEAD